jgi:PLP dependent protein
MILAGEFALVHSIDSLKLAQRFARLIEQGGHRPVDILLQCNVSGEASKSGFELSRWRTDKSQLAAFLETVEQITKLRSLTIQGLMTMAPLAEDPEEARPTFQSLAALRGKLQQEMPQIHWQQLSMGMTDDFEVAVEEGATLLRVGRAIFGERA